PRKCLLVDLGPAASFISANYNSVVPPQDTIETYRELLAQLRREFGRFYQTKHTGWPAQTFSETVAEQHSRSLAQGTTWGNIEYVVWSEIFACPQCGHEFSYWSTAVRFFSCEVFDEFECEQCKALV